jgi:hypothetical protein
LPILVLIVADYSDALMRTVSHRLLALGFAVGISLVRLGRWYRPDVS